MHEETVSQGRARNSRSMKNPVPPSRLSRIVSSSVQLRPLANKHQHHGRRCGTIWYVRKRQAVYNHKLTNLARPHVEVQPSRRILSRESRPTHERPHQHNDTRQPRLPQLIIHPQQHMVAFGKIVKGFAVFSAVCQVVCAGCHCK